MPKDDDDHDHGHTTWVHIEVSLDIDGQVSEYMIEGRPDGGPSHIHLDPVWGGDPIAMLQTVGIALNLRLKDCTLNITNLDERRDDEEPPQMLRALP